MEQILTQSQFLVSLSPFPDMYWNTFSGIELTADYSEISDGRDSFFLTGIMALQPVEISRTGMVDDNKRIFDWAKSFCRNNSDAVLSVIPIKPCQSIEPWDKSVRILGVIPYRVRMFEVDKSSSENSVIELGLISRHVSYGN